MWFVKIEWPKLGNNQYNVHRKKNYLCKMSLFFQRFKFINSMSLTKTNDSLRHLCRIEIHIKETIVGEFKCYLVEWRVRNWGSFAYSDLCSWKINLLNLCGMLRFIHPTWTKVVLLDVFRIKRNSNVFVH